MDSGTALLGCVAVGLLLGATSSVITHQVGTQAGVGFSIVVAIVGFAVIELRGESALFPIVGAMLAFSVVASLLNPHPKGLLH